MKNTENTINFLTNFKQISFYVKYVVMHKTMQKCHLINQDLPATIPNIQQNTCFPL